MKTPRPAKLWHFRFNNETESFVTNEVQAYHIIQVMDEDETVDVFVPEPKQDPTRALIAELDQLQTPILVAEMDKILDKYRK